MDRKTLLAYITGTLERCRTYNSGQELGKKLGKQALEEVAKAAKLDTILGWYHKLARDHAYQLVLVEELQRLGIEIILINRPIAQSPEDQLLLQMQGVIAECEREQIMKRRWRGKPPYEV